MQRVYSMDGGGSFDSFSWLSNQDNLGVLNIAPQPGVSARLVFYVSGEAGTSPQFKRRNRTTLQQLISSVGGSPGNLFFDSMWSSDGSLLLTRADREHKLWSTLTGHEWMASCAIYEAQDLFQWQALSPAEQSHQPSIHALAWRPDLRMLAARKQFMQRYLQPIGHSESCQVQSQMGDCLQLLNVPALQGPVLHVPVDTSIFCHYAYSPNGKLAFHNMQLQPCQVFIIDTATATVQFTMILDSGLNTVHPISPPSNQKSFLQSRLPRLLSFSDEGRYLMLPIAATVLGVLNTVTGSLTQFHLHYILKDHWQLRRTWLPAGMCAEMSKDGEWIFVCPQQPVSTALVMHYPSGHPQMLHFIDGGQPVELQHVSAAWHPDCMQLLVQGYRSVCFNSSSGEAPDLLINWFAVSPISKEQLQS